MSGFCEEGDILANEAEWVTSKVTSIVRLENSAEDVTLVCRRPTTVFVALQTCLESNAYDIKDT